MFKIKSTRLFSIIFAVFTLFSSIHARTFQTDDNRFISYTDTGHGKPIVLVHAFPIDRRLFELARNEIEAIYHDSNIFRIISIDLWGFGQSSPANGQAIPMSEYANEVSKLLEHLNIESAVIGGESMGGYVALAFLEQFPEKVEGLILSDTQSIADSPETKAKRETTAVDVMDHGSESLVNEFISKALSPDTSEKTKLFLKHILGQQDKMAIASALRGMAIRNDTSNILAKTSIPILILAGEQDRLISPKQSHYMHALAKNSKLVIIPNAGHLSSLEQPHTWIWAIVDMFYELY